MSATVHSDSVDDGSESEDEVSPLVSMSLDHRPLPDSSTNGELAAPPTIETASQERAGGVSEARRDTLPAHDRSVPASKHRTRRRAKLGSSGSSQPGTSSNHSSFPTPFRCYGDFCGFELFEEPCRPSLLPSTGAKHCSDDKVSGVGNALVAAAKAKALPGLMNALGMLFPHEELAALSTGTMSTTMLRTRASSDLSSASASTELHVITFKSIALAKANREHLRIVLQSQKRADRPEVADQRTTGAKNAVVSNGSKRRSSLLDSTAALDLRHNSRLRVFGGVGDGVANYYRQVRVCRDCFAIYTLLDSARQLRASSSAAVEAEKHLHQQRLQHKLRDDREQQVARDLDEKKLYLRKPMNGTRVSPSKRSRPEKEASDGLEHATPHAQLVQSPRLNSLVEDSTVALPVLLSSKEPSPGSTGPSSESTALSTPRLHHSATMPALPTTPTSTSASADQRKPSCFALLTSSSCRSKNSASVRGLDKYLRGENRRVEEPVLVEGQLFTSKAPGIHSEAPSRTSTPPTHTRAVRSTEAATVLLVDSDAASLELLYRALSALPTLTLEIESMLDPHEALAAVKQSHYDLVLCERDFAPATTTGVRDGLEFVRLLRQFELQKSIANGTSPALLSRRTAVVCVTTKTSREDLQCYRDAGMDGCVGKPLSHDSLRRTVSAALAGATVSTARPMSSRANAAAANAAVLNATEALAQAKRETLERKRRRRRRLEASSVLPFPALADMDVRDDFVAGTFQLDAETAVPYCVLGNLALQPPPQRVPNTFFNLVVVHDLFDTWERLQILLQPIIARYHGAVQVLVWNYPGQAYTTWRHGALLDNRYHAQCLHALLQYVGPHGRGLWRDAPYFLLGVGHGGSVATAFCTHAPPLDPNVRALVLMNAFAFVDPALAQFLHDSLTVLATTPVPRPDLPVYFHARFLFSAAYLARVSTPLALNLYTAVTNPITLDGRRALCRGALANAEPATAIHVPVLSVCSAQNGLVDASAQTVKLAHQSGLEIVDSIAKALAVQHHRTGRQRKPRCCMISLPGGHEVLQERKHDVLRLLEQLVTGYHETVVAVAQSSSGAPLSGKPTALSGASDESRRALKANARDEDEEAPVPTTMARPKSKGKARSFEDSFIDNVLSTVKQVVVATPTLSAEAAVTPGRPGGANNQLPSPDHDKWTQFQHETVRRATSKARDTTIATTGDCRTEPKSKASPSKIIAMASWDPTTPAFERLSSNIIYKVGDGSKIYPEPKRSDTTTAAPELKEYMAWRVKRNQKRLQRMETQARVIQRAFRAFYARTLLRRLQQARCALALQRLWRAKLARKKYKGLRKEDWAARLLQRHWRGKLGRDAYCDRFRKYVAAVDIQRIVRGFLAVACVARMRQRLREAAVAVQQLVRRFVAKRRAFARRRERNSAMTIQRVFRGHIGRQQFAHERDKFLFATTQSQGIAFGKQMLLEYKLLSTKLQSDVALLVTAKADVEAQAEGLVNEICAFDDGVQLLEAEMHALSRVETEALGGRAGVDEPSRWAVREQKMRLDREFTQMLAQIAQRKEKLSALEETLQQLDRERLAKEEALKGLERKLVVLLDEQQQELAKIKRKQHVSSQLTLETATTTLSSASPGFPSPSWSSLSLGSGLMMPSAAAVSAAANTASAFTQQQREEANALMESTETMMKFGFMSMSMTYFSSMNMVRAMRKIGAHHLTLDSAAAVSNHQWPEYGPPLSSGFQPAAPSGSFPGQQPLQVAGWSVADVGRWLDTLALGQYKRAFADAATDGALLLHLNDDDLKNTLGMDHRLHRKKVLTSVEQLREAERVTMRKLYGASQPESLGSTGGSASSGSPSRVVQPGGPAAPSSTPVVPPALTFASTAPVLDTTDKTASIGSAGGKVVVAFSEFCTLVRHGKLKQLKEALASVPEQRFDPLTVLQAYSPGVGTVYDDVLEKSVFHVNKSDENGNSPLLLAAQNNSLKVAQLLVAKGANPNHQNVRGSGGVCLAMDALSLSNSLFLFVLL